MPLLTFRLGREAVKPSRPSRKKPHSDKRTSQDLAPVVVKLHISMRKQTIRVGAKVVVIGLSTVNYPPGVPDELGTEKLFKSMLGKVYTVKGFDEYGNVELHPTRRDAVWIEPKYLKLRPRKRKHGAKATFR